jgi:hypothetical protein
MTGGRRSKNIGQAEKKVLKPNRGLKFGVHEYIVGGVCRQDRFPELQFATDP